MKTIRLLYPDHLAGGLDTYYFGARLMAHRGGSLFQTVWRQV